MNRVTTTANGEAFVYDGEEVYRDYYDSAGNYHWFGVVTGHHVVRMDSLVYMPSQAEQTEREGE